MAGLALTCIKRVVAAACAAWVAAAWAQAQPGDSDILAAREAASRGQWRALEGYRAKLAGHILEAYPSYWLLSGNIERSDPAEIDAFLKRYADSPLAEGLRREWLKALGAGASWDLFRAEYPLVVGEDPEITCFSFQERLSRNDPEVTAESRALFVAAREVPMACDPVFARAVSDGAITEAQVWDRLRRLLAAGSVKDAKRTNALLAKKTAMVEKLIDHVYSDPQRFFAQEKLGQHPGRDAQELLLFAIERLARNKPDDAADRLETNAARLSADTYRFAWGQIALQGALNHNPRALEWYGHTDPATLTDSQVAWKARAAMRAADWKEVLASIAALSPQEARETNWRYWKARALRATGATDAGDAILKDLAATHTGFYGLLAAEDTGLAVTPRWEGGWRPADADLDRVRALPGIRRALELYRLGLDNEALREWLWAIRGLDDKSLIAAAELAHLANEPDRAIGTAERTVQVHDFAQRFPTPHRDAIASAAKMYDVDEALLYGIVRQESRFMVEARSRAGARGLMQLMPSTARWVARQISIAPFRTDMLARPEMNVQMGAYYFKRVQDDLGNPVMAIAAYNAGPNRARRWRDDRPLDAAVYTETIPFNETRDYVKKVFANAWYYRHRLTGKTVSMRELLGTIPGASTEPAVAASDIP